MLSGSAFMEANIELSQTETHSLLPTAPPLPCPEATEGGRKGPERRRQKKEVAQKRREERKHLRGRKASGAPSGLAPPPAARRLWVRGCRCSSSSPSSSSVRQGCAIPLHLAHSVSICFCPNHHLLPLAQKSLKGK